jgi:hypothetical protein
MFDVPRFVGLGTHDTLSVALAKKLKTIAPSVPFKAKWEGTGILGREGEGCPE